jgi:GntR family transcriptional repressor for pyruvate dehydrogenase complex
LVVPINRYWFNQFLKVVLQMTGTRLTKKVEYKIRQIIAEGHLKISDRLPPERELAEAMNVSRHTLREAIKSLESSGLLKSRPGSGTFVFGEQESLILEPNSNIFPESPRMTDIFQFRWAVEPNICVLAISGATKTGLKAIKENLELQEKALKANDTELWAKADLDYHLRLAELTGNILITTVMKNLSHCIAICVDNSHLNPARIKLYYEGHQKIYQSIVNRDPKGAFFHMEEHLKLLPWQENLRVSTILPD